MTAQADAAHSGMLWREYTDTTPSTLKGFMCATYRRDGTTDAQCFFPVYTGAMVAYEEAAAHAYRLAKEWINGQLAN